MYTYTYISGDSCSMDCIPIYVYLKIPVLWIVYLYISEDSCSMHCIPIYVYLKIPVLWIGFLFISGDYCSMDCIPIYIWRFLFFGLGSLQILIELTKHQAMLHLKINIWIERIPLLLLIFLISRPHVSSRTRTLNSR